MLKNNAKYADTAERVMYIGVLSGISVELDMPVTAIQCNPKAHENAGKIAITRGPVVYCAESIDNGPDLRAAYLCPHGEYTLGECEFLVPNIKTTAYKPKETCALYSKADSQTEEAEFTLIPYYAFANREESSMLVWFIKKD